ncbi:PREDICTED: putative F-box protein At1g67623 [Tarenaya hassleriana]|uniref:putative F-box protein At1g67623 n=1 Tax=Tarenaya hassleriana TaxID=28532 RepID=UPI00053C3656|nr:PREDICTED: putative F-box protein At1g67623 [Tarenaya hassleriana]
MVSSSPSSRKIRKSSKRTTIPFNNLPDDLVLMEVISRVAVSSLADVCSLKLVSKSLHNLSNDAHVFQNVSIDEIPLNSWKQNPRISSFLQNCRNNGNREALFRRGIVNYFGWRRSTSEGFECLVRAAAKKHREAMYIHGMILVCSGSETKHKGLEILSPLVKSSMTKTIENLEGCRERIENHIRGRWTDQSLIKQIQRSYNRDICTCDGHTKAFLVRNTIWNRYGEDKDQNFPICQNCLWSYEVDRFLSILESSAKC